MTLPRDLRVGPDEVAVWPLDGASVAEIAIEAVSPAERAAREMLAQFARPISTSLQVCASAGRVPREAGWYARQAQHQVPSPVRESPMLQPLEHLARFLVVTLGLEVPGQSVAALVVASAVGLTAAMIATTNQCVAAIAVFFGRPNPQRRTARVATPVLLSQSAPDAPGKPRPRAPGEGLAVAAH